jgi:alpha-beta hydrolase superfamily lysophospholipase
VTVREIPPSRRMRRVTTCIGAVTLLVAVTIISADMLSARSTPNAVRANDGASSTNSSSATLAIRSTAGTTAPARPGVAASAARMRASPTPAAPSGPRPWNVAQTTHFYIDPTRSTPPRGTLPAHPGRVLRTIVRWPVTRAGAPAPGRLPLVVFAHGYAVETRTYSALLDDLAAAGMIVAAPELPGESAALSGPPNESDLVNEPCDLEFVAASLEGEPPLALAGALAHAPLVFAGHSDGATAAATAGYSKLDCTGPKPAAIVALSSNDIRSQDVLRGSSPALLAATGTDDEINPVANTVSLWLHVPRPAWLLTVEGGTHLGTFTTDPDRTRVDAIIAAFILAHTVDLNTATRIIASGRLHLYTR